MKKKTLLITGISLLVLSLASVSLAAPLQNIRPGCLLDQTADLVQNASDTNDVCLSGQALRDGSCGNSPLRDGSGNPNAPRRGGGRR